MLPAEFQWIRLGVAARYHEIEGGPATRAGEITEEPWLMCGQWVAKIAGKSGCVAVEHLTRQEEPKSPLDLDPDPEGWVRVENAPADLAGAFELAASDSGRLVTIAVVVDRYTPIRGLSRFHGATHYRPAQKGPRDWAKAAS